MERRRAGLVARRERLAELVAKHPPNSSARLVLEHELSRVTAEIAWLSAAAVTVAELESPPEQGEGGVACQT